MDINIQYFDSIGSTNDELIAQARMGAREGTCIVARSQTAGRGRHGRVWNSQPDSGLYFSILLTPGAGPSFSLITLMAGIAVSDALRTFGLTPDIKWVNDVLVGERKICGILAEAVETPHGPAVVLGIGINLTSQNFSPEMAPNATSIEQETGRRVPRETVCEELVRHLAYFYEVGSSRVDLQACKLEYSIVSPK